MERLCGPLEIPGPPVAHMDQVENHCCGTNSCCAKSFSDTKTIEPQRTWNPPAGPSKHNRMLESFTCWAAAWGSKRAASVNARERSAIVSREAWIWPSGRSAGRIPEPPTGRARWGGRPAAGGRRERSRPARRRELFEECFVSECGSFKAIK